MKKYSQGEIQFKKIHYQVEKLHHGIVYFNFLDPAQQKIIATELNVYPYVQYIFFGGHDFCERKMLCVFTQDYKHFLQWPISIINFSIDFKPNHRMILGAVMNLGISRDTIGDIIIRENNVQIIAKEQLAPFIQNNLVTINNKSIFSNIKSIDQIVSPINKYEEKIIVTNSFRIDGIISNSYTMSRTEATTFVKKGLVRINYEVKTKPSNLVSIGDLVSVKGKGRFIVYKLLGHTRKDNNKILIKKYI